MVEERLKLAQVRRTIDGRRQDAEMPVKLSVESWRHRTCRLLRQLRRVMRMIVVMMRREGIWYLMMMLMSQSTVEEGLQLFQVRWCHCLSGGRGDICWYLEMPGCGHTDFGRIHVSGLVTRGSAVSRQPTWWPSVWYRWLVDRCEVTWLAEDVVNGKWSETSSCDQTVVLLLHGDCSHCSVGDFPVVFVHVERLKRAAIGYIYAEHHTTCERYRVTQHCNFSVKMQSRTRSPECAMSKIAKCRRQKSVTRRR